ncbi:Ca(2+)-independent N-acyltransferase [Pteropus alecto]|uniref:Ca(2+)-independent N-acyltransferase n=1 Tax=Pteropus alecto TaxID=9402 RepID=UPI0007687DA5|nr:Ca(2+)-independent N-acyltransferase [Pteropus alecto]
MGLSPAAERRGRLRLFRLRGSHRKLTSRTAGMGPNDNQLLLDMQLCPSVGPAGMGTHPTEQRLGNNLGRSPGTSLGGSPDTNWPSGPQKSPHHCFFCFCFFVFLELGESVGSQSLVQLSPEEPKQGPLEQGSIQQGEKPVINSETILNEKRAKSDSALKSRSAGKLTKQTAEGEPRPRPGDLIEIFRIGYEHWAIYVEDDCVVHLAPPSDDFEAGSITSIFSNRAVVKYSRLEDVLHGCSWKVNNKLDGTYLPLPVDTIIQRTRKMINKIVQYSLIEGNCEHFVNDLRYGVPRSQQVEHALVEGAKAAGAVISAVVGSIRPKPAPTRRCCEQQAEKSC